jgi:hypothetical protein
MLTRALMADRLRCQASSSGCAGRPSFQRQPPVTTRDVRFRLAKQHESADAEADDSNADCRTDTTVNILTIADFGNG